MLDQRLVQPGLCPGRGHLPGWQCRDPVVGRQLLGRPAAPKCLRRATQHQSPTMVHRAMPQWHHVRDAYKRIRPCPSGGDICLHGEHLRSDWAGRQTAGCASMDEWASVQAALTKGPAEAPRGPATQLSRSEDIFHSVWARKNSPQADHQQQIAVLSAVTEVLVQQGIALNAGAFFAAFLSSLDGYRSRANAAALGGADESSAAATCVLLSLVIPKTPRAVVHRKLRDALGVIDDLCSTPEGCQAIVRSAVQCKKQLLLVAATDGVDAATVCQSAGALLPLCADTRPKVRKRALESMASVLETLRGSSSKQQLRAHSFICETLCKFAGDTLPLAAAKGTSEADDSMENFRRALHLLGGLRQLMPFLNDAALDSIIEIVSLLLVQSQGSQPLLATLVVDCAKTVVVGPSSEPTENAPSVSAKSLESLLKAVLQLPSLDRVATATASHEVDALVSATSLIQHAMLKLGKLNPSASSRLLPNVFHVLLPLLTETSHEALVFAASQCLTDLARFCLPLATAVDYASGDVGPTIVERVFLSIQNLFNIRYQHAWAVLLPISGVCCEVMGKSALPYVSQLVQVMGSLHSDRTEDIYQEQQLGVALGLAIQGMGPEKFFSVFSLNLDGPWEKARVWLLPILRRYAASCPLSFFAQNIIPGAKLLAARAEQASTRQGQGIHAQRMRGMVLVLWGTLPAFCKSPPDISPSFKLIAKDLGDGISKQPELRSTICASLTQLICGTLDAHHQARSRREDAVTAQEKAKYALEESRTAEDIAAIAKFSKNFLPVLFNVYVAAGSTQRNEIPPAIRAFSLIADKDTLHTFFLTVLKRLLEAIAEAPTVGDGMQEDSYEKQATYMELALAMVEGLDVSAVAKLNRAVKPMLISSDARVQKKAYKLMHRLLAHDSEECLRSINDSLDSLRDGLGVCAPAAKRNRLKCLQEAILVLQRSPSSENLQKISWLISEIILGTKEQNNKTRTLAYDLLVDIGHTFATADAERDVSPGDTEGLLHTYYVMVVGGMAGATPHMISASVTAVSRLLFEFPDAFVASASDLLPPVLHLLNAKSREVIKSVLGFVKVLVMRFNEEQLREHLQQLVHGVLLWSNERKERFKLKVRVIMERLVRRCGVHAVQEVVPDEHKKLMASLRKQRNKQERKKASRAGSQVGDEDDRMTGQTRRSHTMSRWDHAEVFSDNEDLEDEDDRISEPTQSGTSTKKRALARRPLGSVRLQDGDAMDEGGANGADPLDLLARGSTQSQQHELTRKKRRRAALPEEEDDDDPRDRAGKLDFSKVRPKEFKKIKRNEERDSSDEDEDIDIERKTVKTRGVSAGSVSGRSGGAMSTGGQSRASKHHGVSARSRSGFALTGTQFRSKKGAGGDSQGKQKLEPYAYWPMDPKLLNRRQVKKTAARRGLSKVVGRGLTAAKVCSALVGSA
eukprot:scaffold1057_cov459-Prasinococcus_capsulatus_cf.AAC.2